MTLTLALLLFAASDEYSRGLDQYKAGDLTAATRSFEKATRSHPQFAAAWKALGVVYAAQGNYALAVEPLKRACELQPHLADSCYYFGRNLFELNRYEESLVALDKALAAERSLGRTHLARAQSLEALGRRDAAEQAFKTAIELTGSGTTPDDDPRIAYAVFLMRDARLAEALRWLEPAAKDHRDNSRAQLVFGRALFEQGRSAEAVGPLESAVRLDPESAQAALLLGRVLMHLGRRAEALVHLERGRVLEARTSHRGSSTSTY